MNVGDTGRQLADRIDALAASLAEISGQVVQHVAAGLASGETDAAGLSQMAERGASLTSGISEYARRVRDADYKPAVVYRGASVR